MTTVKIDPMPFGSVREFPVGQGLPSVDEIHAELLEYTDVLMGRVTPPLDNGVMTLMEVANAYLSRALELTMLIHQGERDGQIEKRSPYYMLRTGELRDFTELASKAQELGSRRLTDAQRIAQLKEFG